MSDTLTRISFCQGMLDAVLLTAAGDHPLFPGGVPADSRQRIQAHAAAIIRELSQRAPAPGKRVSVLSPLLRLVVDNDAPPHV